MAIPPDRRGRWTALAVTAMAVAVLGVAAAVISTGRFTIRYEVGDLREKIERFDRETYGTIPLPEAIELNRGALRDLFVQSTGGEERLGAGSLRIEGSTMIARVTAAHHWDLWGVLTNLRRP